MKTGAALLCLLLIVLLSGSAQGDPVTLESLLTEMTDRAVIARVPQPAYTCRQFSSYDRASTSPDNHSNWFANNDRNQFIRTEERGGRKEHVMMDAEGPGAIVRFWATWTSGKDGEFSNGVLRVYLDGGDEPVIEGTLQEVIDQGLLAGAPLSQSVSPESPYGNRGHNLYLPIPYAKSCKMTYCPDPQQQDGEVLYYQINYRTYGEGAQVESFSMQRLADAKATLQKAQQELMSPAQSVPPGKKTVLDARVDAGGESQAVELEGPGAISELSLRLEASDMPQALRSTVLRIEFDGEPAVWVPVGDFFGVGYLPSPHQTWYTGSTEQGELTCRWVMPFAKNAKISFVNVGERPAEIVASHATVSPWEWDDRSMHFHSTWREYNRLATRKGSPQPRDGAYDVNYVEVEGQGVYAGDTLTIFNGAASWWGEGDEKIYVDGEAFPSHFGTGTEDYYGYAWCRPESFTAPFHAQPDGGGNLRGGFSVNSRYRSLDAIPFTSSLRFDMENWHWADTRVNYAPTTYFYARPGASTNVKPSPAAAAKRVVLERSEIVDVFTAPGAVEGERLEIAKKTGGETVRQFSSHWGWSNEQQLWWTDPAVGDELVLELPDMAAGVYRVEACLTKAVDYAKVEFEINGQPAEVGVVDRFNNSVAHDVVELGGFRLKDKGNLLTVRVVGKNERAEPRRMFGLDYLKFTKE